MLRSIFYLLICSYALSASITGIVYKDYNLNGQQDNNEYGVSGVVVKAYDANNDEAASATTDSNGNYSLATQSGAYRIEITPPSSLKVSTGIGSGNPLVARVADGSVYNVGVFAPNEYAPQKQPLITILNFNGDPANSTVEDLSAVLKLPYSARGDDPTVDVEAIANAKDVGSVWGVAYSPRRHIAYVSTLVRRHTGYASGQTPGTIWKVSTDGYGTQMFAQLNAGAIPSNSARHLAGKDTPNHDPIFSEVGKLGLGDIDISSDESKLYVMNLYDKKLYVLDADDGSILNQIAVGNPFNGCNSSDVRPWAVKVRNNEVYIGTVCDNDLSQGAAVSKLTGAGFTTVKQIPLDYKREIITYSTSKGLGNRGRMMKINFFI